MSGFAVLLDFTSHALTGSVGRRRRGDRLPRSARRAAHRAGPCTLMHAALWTTVEAEDEAQPQRHVDRDFWLAADARVDNRDELAAMLEGTSRQPLHTDADLILAAYERWGRSPRPCRRRLRVRALGRRTRRAAGRSRSLRPASGVPRPHSRRAGGGVDVARGAGRRRRRRWVDEAYLAGFLHGVPPRDRTIWAGVQRVAPGHRRIVGRDHDVTERYWSPDLTPWSSRSRHDRGRPFGIRRGRPLPFAHPRRRRDRPERRLGLVDGHRHRRRLAKVHPMSLVYRIDPEAFELPFIEAVADHLGIEGHVIEADELTTLDAAATSGSTGSPSTPSTRPTPPRSMTWWPRSASRCR